MACKSNTLGVQKSRNRILRFPHLGSGVKPTSVEIPMHRIVGPSSLPPKDFFSAPSFTDFTERVPSANCIGVAL